MEQNDRPAGREETPVPAPLDPAAAEDLWDQRYAQRYTLWSGQPNAALVRETTGLKPGRALDVGCGEGADALWLAERGWEVTALDVSGVALERAARQAETLGMTLTFVHSGLVEARLPAGSFDLVSAQYPVLLRTAGNVAERVLLDAVAPGGTLLVVHHPMPAPEEAQAKGLDFDPRDYVGPADVAALLDDAWQVQVDEVRPRHVAAGAGAHHTEDVVLRARRLR